MVRSQPPLSIGRRAVELTVVANGTASLTFAELAAMRQQPIEKFAAVLRPQLLKHSDEQTLSALAALSNALDHVSVAGDFREWAIVSSTRYLGRAAFAAVIDKYRLDGPWGVSVQVIPHTTPHAVAGTASLALRSHAPSIGAGAADGEETQALLATAALLQRPEIAGAWILLTGWSPQSAVDVAGSLSPPKCIAAALAVVNARSELSAVYGSLGRIEIEVSSDIVAPMAANADAPGTPLTELIVAADAGGIVWRETHRGIRVSVELATENRLAQAFAASSGRQRSRELLHDG